MRIKDQIRAMRDRRGVTVVELAGRLGVSDQAVRYWEAGRSYPSKKIAAQIERELDFRIDWSEGEEHSGDRATANALIDQRDIDLLLLICRLPSAVKLLLADLARAYLEAANRGGRTIQDREETAPVPPFEERKQERAHAGKGPQKTRGRKAPAR
jgi:transcriptional regulator with XRE-family HTH domain